MPAELAEPAASNLNQISVWTRRRIIRSTLLIAAAHLQETGYSLRVSTAALPLQRDESPLAVRRQMGLGSVRFQRQRVQLSLDVRPSPSGGRRGLAACSSDHLICDMMDVKNH